MHQNQAKTNLATMKFKNMLKSEFSCLDDYKKVNKKEPTASIEISEHILRFITRG